MVLDPLADVGIRMFVTIRVDSSQFMVDILSHCERSQSQDDANHSQCDSCAE